MRSALIYNPYFKSLGGGEKYTATLMYSLLKDGWEVTLAWPNSTIINKLCDRFDIDLSGINTNSNLYQTLTSGSIIKKYQKMRQFDVSFFVSDGSIPFLFSKKNLLHFQVPFSNVLGNSLTNRIKFLGIDHVICNSRFTKNVIDHEYGIDSKVLYPPATMIKPKKKEPYILSVGRFDEPLNAKRQDILIKAFREAEFPKPWKLILAGGVLNNKDILSLKEQAKDQDIQFIENPSWKEMSDLYASASIYWHATGYDIDQAFEPEKVEHFGISTVEAMSSGAIPLVYKAGGQIEIVTNGNNGFTWTTVDELIQKTRKIISMKNIDSLRTEASKTSKQYSQEEFDKNVKKIIS